MAFRAGPILGGSERRCLEGHILIVSLAFDSRGSCAIVNTEQPDWEIGIHRREFLVCLSVSVPGIFFSFPLQKKI